MLIPRQSAGLRLINLCPLCYRVVRFAAREVFHDPFASVREVNFMAIGDIANVCARMRVDS